MATFLFGFLEKIFFIVEPLLDTVFFFYYYFYCIVFSAFRQCQNLLLQTKN